ncbi:jg410, partial [Pararge aegeria aegeria]
MKKSQALMVPSKDLTTVPEDVFHTAVEAEVHIVDLSRNKLTSVPIGVQHLRETLTQLLLASNNIEVVPPEVGVCKHLQYIDLGKNNLADLPIELGDL